MTYEISIDGKDYRLELSQSEGRWSCRLDGREIEVDAVLARPDVLSLRIANQAYEVGNRMTLMIKSATRPPTMTIANGRCESVPIPCEVAAGNSPRVATSMVIMIGRSSKTAPSTAASSISWSAS